MQDGTVRAVRLLFIIVALLHKPRRTCDLARRFHRSMRQIERDLRDLGQGLHVPIYYEKSEGLWYLNREDWEIADLLDAREGIEQTT